MAKKSSIFFGFLLITLGCIINETSARDVRLIKIKDVKPETLQAMKGEKEAELKDGEIDQNLEKEIEEAKKLLEELKTMKEGSKGELKSELSSIMKSESLLNEISNALKSGKCGAEEAHAFAGREASFYRAWQASAYNSVVPEKEKEFMDKIKLIVKLLKETL